MNGKWISCTLALGMVWVLGSAANAEGPWDQLVSLRRVEADPNKSYQVTEDSGPWMILACSFSGEGAKQQARELVLELRKRYKLPAYTHNAKFAFGEEQGRGFDRRGRAWRMGFGSEVEEGTHRSTGTSEIEEVAVLVGDYQTVDDPNAKRTLRKLKYSEPKSLDVKQRGSTTQSLAGWRMIQKSGPERSSALGGDFNTFGKKWGEYKWRSVQKEKKFGPMGHAFVTTNPLLPKDFFAPKGIDPLVVELNKGLKYSLLDCPGKYTVQVATFKGNVIIKQDEIQAIENGKAMKGNLDKAAKDAERLTMALRYKGWEAYQFHDRNASIVTVGSFDSVGTPRSDGRTEINRDIFVIMQTFGARPVTIPGAPAGATHLKSFVGIPLDIQPIPVEVPKRSISRELANGR